MSNLKNAEEFLDYITNPLSRTSIESLYNNNNISYERTNLFNDFTISIINLVFSTYMGDKYTNDIGKIKHFEWCWNKVINDFNSENIHFKYNEELFNYMSTFIFGMYYSIEYKDDNLELESKISTLLSHIFDYNGVKTRSDMDTFIEIYKIFDKSLNKCEEIGF